MKLVDRPDALEREGETPPESSSAPGNPRRRSSARRPAKKRRFRVIAAVMIGIVLLLAIGGGVSGYLAKRYADAFQARVIGELRAGQTDLDAGKAASRRAASSQSAGDLQEASAAFESGRRHFERARAIADSDPYLNDARKLKPAANYLDPRLKAVDGVAEMGIAMSEAGVDAVAFQAVLTAPRPGESSGQKLVDTLKASPAPIAKLKADFETANVAANSVDLHYVPKGEQAAFQSAHNTISQGLAALTEFQGLTPALLEILGANGKRTYLIEQVNPAELRAGGGFIGTYSVMEADSGNLKIIRGGDITELDYPRPVKGQRGYVPPPPTTVDFYGDKSWVLGDSNLFPDFPTNARQGITFLKKEAGIQADGVIAIDPQLIAYLLEVTGPITVPGYNIVVQASTFVDQVFELEDAAVRQPGRKAILSAIAQPLLDKVSGLPSGKWSDLVTELNLAVARRDLQTYFVNQTAEHEMDRIGWSGVQNPAKAADYMMEVENNFSGDKSNHWVTRNYNVSLSVQNGQLHHAISVTITDAAPINAYGGSYYRFYVRLYFPANGTGSIANVKGDKYPTDEKPADLKMVDGWQQINVPVRGSGTATVNFTYDTPLGDLGDGHDIYWQKQAGTTHDTVSVSWTNGGQTYKATGDLLQDRIIHLTASGVAIEPGQAGGAKLPSFSL